MEKISEDLRRNSKTAGPNLSIIYKHHSFYTEWEGNVVGIFVKKTQIISKQEMKDKHKKRWKSSIILKFQNLCNVDLDFFLEFQK